MELLPSWTKAGSWTLGRDPLGMQATSVRMYRTLVPGLTNVTNRLRYYSFYCWVIQHYEETEHSGDEAKWRIFIRRAEALYALACNIVDPQQSDGLAGGLWAGAFRQALPNDTIDLRPHTDQPGQSGQYLKATRGNFGQFYIASMTEVELLTPSTRIPIVSNQLGRDMASAFAESVGKTTALISNAIRTGTVTPAELAEIGDAAHPSRIPADSKEMAMLRNYLLATNELGGSGSARRSSAWLLLDLLRLGVSAEDETGVRKAFYNRHGPDGSPYRVTGLTIDRWMAFQANELCHIAFEAILNGLLTELQKYPLGLEPNLLITKLLAPLLAKLGTSGRSWRDWSAEIGEEFIGSEEALAEPILSTLRDVKLASNQDGLSSALQLIAALWHRWGGEDTSVRTMIEGYAGRGGRSLSGVLRTLDAQASNTVEDALMQTIRRHLIADHLTIAGRKLAASGTFTYHFTLSDGVVSDGRVTNYAYTNPRIKNLIRFLRDANLYDGSTVTKSGTRFLSENQPV
ncbi:hypothetical protein CCC_01384 [Paramagnetospirillum magnetotacticum MS-1]|uniref:Uncharacterized protein n=1 Tax=Paramagnetospirillum magnetotacticum MS-1 TaxID=272627 RepID=A0A0C2UVM5_PARME|nr:hypothetical protein [Paramagnetospirillum magnetotacticum]KIL96891.1 hypothetical protein CCC_01384 [Paramagnetospirillum magnetotacticum MS-1]